MTVGWCESVYSCLYFAPWVLRQHMSCFFLQLALHVLRCIVTPRCVIHFHLSSALICQLVVRAHVDCIRVMSASWTLPLVPPEQLE